MLDLQRRQKSSITANPEPTAFPSETVPVSVPTTIPSSVPDYADFTAEIDVDFGSSSGSVCDFCPKILGRPNIFHVRCFVRQFYEDARKAWGMCFNGEGDDASNAPTNFKLPDANYVAEARQFLAYYTEILAPKPNECALQAVVDDLSSEISSASSGASNNWPFSNANSLSATYDMLEGLTSLANGSVSVPGTPFIPKLASPYGFVIASVRRVGTSDQFLPQSNAMVFFADAKPAFGSGCADTKGPRFKDNNGNGYAPGNCKVDVEHIAGGRPKRYPAVTAAQVYDANSFEAAYTNATAQYTAEEPLVVRGKLGNALGLFTNLESHGGRTTWQYGEKTGDGSESDFENTQFRRGSCFFPC